MTTTIEDELERALRPRNTTRMHCLECDDHTYWMHVDWEYDGDAPTDYGEPWNDRGQAIWECRECRIANYGPYPWQV